MAGWLQNECVAMSGRGGFITKGISNLVNYVTSSTASVRLLNSYPPSTAFLTVSITGDIKDPSPGNTDPSIAMLLEDSVREAWSNSLPGSPTRQLLAKRSNFYRSQSVKMRTGGNRPWWSASADLVAQNEMTYECDAKLGRPKEVDCLKIEFGELGADGDKLDLTPAVAKTLSSSKFTKARSQLG
ncbi:MAG: hypothetical protein Q9195_003377 [Heterodermia aff. obscurata]